MINSDTIQKYDTATILEYIQCNLQKGVVIVNLFIFLCIFSILYTHSLYLLINFHSQGVEPIAACSGMKAGDQPGNQSITGLLICLISIKKNIFWPVYWWSYDALLKTHFYGLVCLHLTCSYIYIMVVILTAFCCLYQFFFLFSFCWLLFIISSSVDFKDKDGP